MTNLLHKNAIITKKPQAVLREDRVTMRFDEAEALYIGLPKEMRQIVLQAVGSLPHKVNPNDPPGRWPLRRSLKVASGKFATRARLEIAFESDGFRLAVESDGGFYAPRFVLGGV